MIVDCPHRLRSSDRSRYRKTFLKPSPSRSLHRNGRPFTTRDGEGGFAWAKMIWVPFNLEAGNKICQDQALSDADVADWFRGWMLGASNSFIAGQVGAMLSGGYQVGKKDREDAEAKQKAISAKRSMASRQRKPKGGSNA